MEHPAPLSPHLWLREDGLAVCILDQSLLPNREEFLQLSTQEQLIEAIVSLRVRGAPAIGIFAGYALSVLARQLEEPGFSGFLARLERQAGELARARPTAVNLSWALERMLTVAREGGALPRPALLSRLEQEALAIHRQDIAMCRAIAQNGLSLLNPGDGLLTHCNAGPLATSQYGTALGPILLGRERGMQFRVFADETRPLLQGARLTAWELSRTGVDVTVICDNMASMVMKNGWVQACLVGCDRVAANGDTANKIGTSGVAILAQYYHVPFYVLGPTSTIDLGCPTGADIPIELRDGEEIRCAWYHQPMVPRDVPCYNPAFDVTDHRLISAIITDRGICYPPYSQSLRALFEGEEPCV